MTGIDLAEIRARAEAAAVVLSNGAALPVDWPVRLERSAADVPWLLDRLDRAEAALARVRELAEHPSTVPVHIGGGNLVNRVEMVSAKSLLAAIEGTDS